MRINMMEMKHFSHGHHPLIWVEVNGDDESGGGGGGSSRRVCNGCQEPIITTSSGYYRCGSSAGDGCEFTLHKRCAELPQQIENYPGHPKHPLVLIAFPPPNFSSYYCDECGRSWKWFTYHCDACTFGIDVNCAFAYFNFLELQEQTKEIRVLFDENEIHQHPLTLHLKQATFRCDFCYTERRDLPYICTDTGCTFSVHKRCAQAPPTLSLIHHHPDHPLRLSSSVPETYRSFFYYCDICKGPMLPDQRLYYCANCRFFTHVNCAFDALDHVPSGGLNDDPEEEEEEIDHNDPFMNLPFQDSEAMTDALSRYFKDSITTAMSTLLSPDHHQDDDNSTELVKHHWSHTDHPLTLVEGLSDNVANIVRDDSVLTVCDVCVRPISIPYYFCGQCDFYLHEHCAMLPPELLDHILHPNHPLELVCIPDPRDLIECKGCESWCNKFLYRCDTCEFYLDVNCAFLPKRIKHEKHKHPLLQCLVSRQISDASGLIFNGIAFACDKASCSFSISLLNMMLPRGIFHRYDKEHPILLTYPPVKDHPQEFFCELCETEIHPKYWMYHCGPCAFSFHTRCLYRWDSYSYVKWESLTYTSDHKHQHRLSYTRKKKKSKKFLCSRCNFDINDRLILECKPCKFQICVECS